MTVTDVVGGADVDTEFVTSDVGDAADDADAVPSFDAEPHAPQSPTAANSNVARLMLAWTLRTACWFRPPGADRTISALRNDQDGAFGRIAMA